MLIGEDTKFQRKFVRWEAEVAIEKECTLIGINLNGARGIDDRCPAILGNVGAIFVAFSPKIVAYALEHYRGNHDQDRRYPDRIYKELGYDV